LGVAAGAAEYIPGHRAALFAELLAQSDEQSLVFNSRYVVPELSSTLVGYDVEDTLGERYALLRRTRVPGDDVASIIRYELMTYLGSLLDRIDRMSMASGLEARVPFLDISLVEWGLSLSSTLKLKGRANKRVVKELARRTLHRSITDGAKSGFGVPLGDWFRSSAFAGLVARLRDPDHSAADLFDRRTVAGLLRDHLTGKHDHGQVLWLISNVYMWHEVHDSAPMTTAFLEIGAA
jgi:asparagine synthase (glutamine-hydrolysing)